MTARRYDGLAFAVGFAALSAASWLFGVLLIGIAEILADDYSGTFELGEALDILSTIVAIAGGVAVPATVVTWCIIVKARRRTIAVAALASILFYIIGTLLIFRLWEWFNQPIVGVG